MRIKANHLLGCVGVVVAGVMVAPWLSYIPAVRNNETAMKIVTQGSQTFTSLQPRVNASQACEQVVSEFLKTGKAVAVPIDRDDNHPKAPQMSCAIVRASSAPKS